MFRFISVILLSLFICSPTYATSSKWDGSWIVYISNECTKEHHEVVFTIKDANLIADENTINLSGAIKDNGRMDVVITYNNNTFYSKGQFTSNTGNGTWQNDQCRGTWRASRRSNQQVQEQKYKQYTTQGM